MALKTDIKLAASLVRNVCPSAVGPVCPSEWPPTRMTTPPRYVSSFTTGRITQEDHTNDARTGASNDTRLLLRTRFREQTLFLIKCRCLSNNRAARVHSTEYTHVSYRIVLDHLGYKHQLLSLSAWCFPKTFYDRGSLSDDLIGGKTVFPAFY